MRGLLVGDASKPDARLLTTHEHETHAFEHGDECVVGEFVLAYPNYFNTLTPYNQSPLLAFFVISAFVYKNYPHFPTLFPQLYRGSFELWITRTSCCRYLQTYITIPFVVVENSPFVYSRC